LQVQRLIFGTDPRITEFQVRASTAYSPLYSSPRDSVNFVLQDHYYGPIKLDSSDEFASKPEFGKTFVFLNRSYSQLMSAEDG
jgi:hypothetical protein